MFKFPSFLIATTVVFSLFAFSSETEAQSFQDEVRNQSYAGLYLNVPLGKDKKSFKDRMEFGFSAGYRRENRWQHHGIKRNQFVDASLVKLNFNGKGFDKLNMAGLNIVGKDAMGNFSTFYLDGDEQEEDKILTKGVVTYTGIMVALFGVAVGAAVIAY